MPISVDNQSNTQQPTTICLSTVVKEGVWTARLRLLSARSVRKPYVRIDVLVILASCSMMEAQKLAAYVKL